MMTYAQWALYFPQFQFPTTVKQLINPLIQNESVCVCGCVCAYMCVCVRAYVCVCLTNWTVTILFELFSFWSAPIPLTRINKVYNRILTAGGYWVPYSYTHTQTHTHTHSHSRAHCNFSPVKWVRNAWLFEVGCSDTVLHIVFFRCCLWVYIHFTVLSLAVTCSYLSHFHSL